MAQASSSALKLLTSFVCSAVVVDLSTSSLACHGGRFGVDVKGLWVLVVVTAAVFAGDMWPSTVTSGKCLGDSSHNLICPACPTNDRVGVLFFIEPGTAAQSQGNVRNTLSGLE